MFKIGEFSKLAQVSIRMLRYYDEIGLLKPADIDPRTGYRMYSVGQLPTINRIVYLRDSGFQIAEIAEIVTALEKSDGRSIVEQLDRKYIDVENTIQAENEKLRKIKIAKEAMLSGGSEMCYNISIKSVPGYQVLSLRKTVDSYYAEKTLWEELSSFAAQWHIEIGLETFSIYHDTEYKEADVDIELCVPVKQMGKSRDGFRYRYTEAVPNMAYTMVFGDFSNIAGTYLAFAQWLEKNSRYRMCGCNRQVVHRGPWNESDSEKYLTEIQIPLEKI